MAQFDAGSTPRRRATPTSTARKWTAPPRGRPRHCSSWAPRRVVRKLVHALEHPRPRRRYYITVPAYVAAVLARVLPGALQDRIIDRL